MKLISRTASAAIMLGLAVWAAACAAIPYDDQTDKLVTQLQTDVDTQLVSLISLEDQVTSLNGKTDADSVAALAAANKKLAYSANLDAYNKIDVDLISLKLRVDASPNATTPTIDFDICKIKQALLGLDTPDEKALCETPAPNPPPLSFKDLHQKGELSANTVIATEQLLDTELQGLITYETVLKGGGSGSTAASAKPASTGAAQKGS